MRDRMVKSLQYGCQMLVGFYGGSLSQELASSLALTRRVSSTSRKAFWLFKSLNHVCEVMTKMRKPLDWAAFFSVLEQLCLVMYYFMENLVFFSRVQLLPLKETDIDVFVNWSWFAGDLACVIAGVLQLLARWRSFDADSLSSLVSEVVDVFIVSAHVVSVTCSAELSNSVVCSVLYCLFSSISASTPWRCSCLSTM